MIRDISPFLMGPSFMRVIYWLRASLAHYAHDATFFSLQDGIIKDLCTMQHLLLLPLPITFFVKVSGAIAAAHIICREPFKALVAV